MHTESDDINAPLLDFKFLNLLKLKHIVLDVRDLAAAEEQQLTGLVVVGENVRMLFQIFNALSDSLIETEPEVK